MKRYINYFSQNLPLLEKWRDKTQVYNLSKSTLIKNMIGFLFLRFAFIIMRNYQAHVPAISSLKAVQRIQPD